MKDELHGPLLLYYSTPTITTTLSSIDLSFLPRTCLCLLDNLMSPHADGHPLHHDLVSGFKWRILREPWVLEIIPL
jgi:hypothetical protein